MNKIAFTILIFSCLPCGILAKEPPVRVIGPDDITIRDFCMSPGGAYVLATHGNEVNVYELQSGDLCATVKGEDPSEILSLDLSEDSTWLVTGTAARNLNIFNLITGERQMVKCSDEMILTVDAHVPSGLIAAGTYGGEVLLLDFQGHVLEKFTNQNDAISKVTISQDGRLMAVAGMNGTVRLIRLTGEKEDIMLCDKSATCRYVAFNNDATYLSAAYDNGKVLRWRIDNNESFHEVKPVKVSGWVTSVCWHNDNMTWTACNASGKILIFTQMGNVYKAKMKGIVRKISFVDPNASDLHVILSLTGKGLRIIHASDMQLGNPSNFDTSRFWYQTN